MIILYGLIAVYIAWIWVDYYRLIDIYETEQLKYFILTFFLGCASVLIVFAINLYFLDDYQFRLKNEIVNDFLFSVFKIGLVEEVAKLVPFLIVLLLFRNIFNEPIDYIAFICVSALGFSAAENFLYFRTHGPEIINSRAILSTVSHMFDTALIAYGIILYKYRKKGIYIIFLFLFLAAVSHGIYDFWLLFEGAKSYGLLITIIYFFITVSLFAVILNNALNNSSFFTYKKVVDSNNVSNRLLFYYAILFLIQFLLLMYLKNFTYALGNFIYALFFAGIIIIVTCSRLSRFILVKGRWEKLKIELPFSFSSSGDVGVAYSPLKVRIKGESNNSSKVNAYYEEYFFLRPFSKRRTYLGSQHLAYIEQKLFLDNYKIFYLVKVFIDNDQNGDFERMLIQPKGGSPTKVNNKYPIVGLLKIKNIEELKSPETAVKSLMFLEWAYIKPKTTS